MPLARGLSSKLHLSADCSYFLQSHRPRSDFVPWNGARKGHKCERDFLPVSTRFAGCPNFILPSGFKVFRYSFIGTIPNCLNRLVDSLLLVRSTWNLQYSLVLDWTLAWFTFCENRCFHDNDEQKSSKIVKLKFYAIQISLWKANTNISNCGVWQTKYTRTKKFSMFVLK